MKLTPCIELFFTDLPFPERIAKVKEAGFSAAEFWHPKNKDLNAVAAACRQHGVTITSLVGGPLNHGLNNPEEHDEMLAELDKAIAAAKVVDCRRIIVLTGNTRPGVTRVRQTAAVVEGLRRMAPAAEEAGVILVLECLNTAVDHAGYFLDRIDDAVNIIRQVDHPCVKALIDIYHSGIMEGNLIEKIRDGIDAIGHFHAAGIPGRHELTAGEQNYPAICRTIDATGFDGYMGLEYKPLKPSLESLVEQRTWING